MHQLDPTRLQATQSLSKLYKSLSAFWSAAGETPYHGIHKDPATADAHTATVFTGVVGVCFWSGVRPLYMLYTCEIT